MTANSLKRSGKAGYDPRDPTPQLGQNVRFFSEQHQFLVLGYDVIGGFPCPNVSGCRLDKPGCTWDAKGLGVFGRRGVNGTGWAGYPRFSSLRFAVHGLEGENHVNGAHITPKHNPIKNLPPRSVMPTHWGYWGSTRTQGGEV